MYYPYTTQVPNELFDQYLHHLNQSELKVILVVIRQTLGYIDRKTKKRKRKDWIAMGFFQRKTGLTRKSISIAIHDLIEKELLVALDYYERELRSSKDRRGKKRIYYAYAPYFRASRRTWVEKFSDKLTYGLNTKLTPTKEVLSEQNTHQNQTDYQRYQQIQRNRQQPQNRHKPNDSPPRYYRP